VLYFLHPKIWGENQQGEFMKNREALLVAVATLSADIDDLIMAANEACRTGDTDVAFDALQTVCQLTQARTKLRALLAKVEREQ
jgi:hypothetical protein